MPISTFAFRKKLKIRTPPPLLSTIQNVEFWTSWFWHLYRQNLSISWISQLLLTRFWWNFKDRFLGTSRTASNCHGDICPGNICPRNICPYQEYLSSSWPNFDETLKNRFRLSWWYLSRQHLSLWHLSISGISQL